jgi:putative beta barrel porin BBP7
MSLYRMKTGLATWIIVLLVGLPVFGEVSDMQLFAPASQDMFGGGPRANEGWFFNYDVLHWSISAPDTTTVGFPNLTRTVWYNPAMAGVVARTAVQHNTLDTSELNARYQTGHRIEVGNVYGHDGVMFNYWRLGTQNQTITANGVDMVFQDEPTQPFLFGYVAAVDSLGNSPIAYFLPMELHDLPLTFDEVQVHSRVETWGTELMYLRRTHPVHNGILEFSAGVRYMEVNESFNVDARGEPAQLGEDAVGDARFLVDSVGNPIAPGNILADSNWYTSAENHIVGPQVGMHYAIKGGRWSLTSDGKFFAGFNRQNIDQRGTLGSHLADPFPGALGPANVPVPVTVPFVPLTMQPTTFNHGANFNEWSPGVELRVNLKYQVTRAVSFKFGWSALWMDGIARSSNMIDYSLSTTSVMGINETRNRQDMLIHGAVFGIEVNR